MQTPKLSVTCFKTRLPALGILLLALFAMHTARADNWTYIVEDGDTLWDIASRYLRVQSFWRNLKILNPARYAFANSRRLAAPTAFFGESAISLWKSRGTEHGYHEASGRFRWR